MICSVSTYLIYLSADVGIGQVGALHPAIKLLPILETRPRICRPHGRCVPLYESCRTAILGQKSVHQAECRTSLLSPGSSSSLRTTASIMPPGLKCRQVVQLLKRSPRACYGVSTTASVSCQSRRPDALHHQSSQGTLLANGHTSSHHRLFTTAPPLRTSTTNTKAQALPLEGITVVSLEQAIAAPVSILSLPLSAVVSIFS